MAKKKTTKKKSTPATRKKTTGKTTGQKTTGGTGGKQSTKKKTTKKKTPVRTTRAAGKSTAKKTTKKKTAKKTTKQKTTSKKTAKTTTTKKTTKKKSGAGQKSGGKKKTATTGKTTPSKRTAKKTGSKKVRAKKKSTTTKKTTRAGKTGTRGVGNTRSKSGTTAPAPEPSTATIPNNGDESHKAEVLRKISDTAKREAAEKDLSPEEIRAKAAAAIIPAAAPKKLKSPLIKRDLKAFAERLLEKRAELVGDLTSMEAGALLGKDSANLSNMPQHMADIGSDNYEQELTLGLMESEREMLIEIDEALARINAGTFGVCEATGEPISKARLEAKPWAKYSIQAARAMERAPRF